MIQKFIKGIVITVMIVGLVTPATPAQAAKIDCNDPRLSNNDIQFWNPCDMGVTCKDVGVFTGVLPAETIQKLENGNVKGLAEQNKARYDYAAEKTGVPWQVIAAIHYREGGMDPKKSIADGSLLTAGVSADGLPISSDPNIDTAAQTNHYLNNASNVYDLDKNALNSWNYDDWANAFLAYNRGYMFKHEGVAYSESPYVMNYLDEEHINMKWSKADSYYKGARLNGLYDAGARDANVGAIAVAAYLGFDFKGANIGPGEECTSGGAVQGEIAKTAVNLSWPERKGLTLKPEYEAALKEADLTGAGCGPNGADCGVFVATVLRVSGVDKDMPIGTSYMMNYMKTNYDKYDKVSADNTGDLKPGDIFVVNSGGGEGANGHIMIYVGDEATDGGQDNASASCGERGADRGGNIYFSDDRGAYEIFRKK